VLFLVALGSAEARAAMSVERFDAPPTAKELASFKSEISRLQPGSGGNLRPKNDWAQHASGQRTKAMGLMYEMTHDQAILDRMIVFCDAILSERNDLAPAPVGQHTIWTGSIEPTWPNSAELPIGTGGEQGDAIGHLGYCARLILETPGIWNSDVRVGDAKGYGATYLERAQRFVREADHSLDEHVLSELLDLSNLNRMYWRAGNPYQTGSVPWNQQVMFTYAFQNLAAAHLILRDDAARAKRYDAIVKSSLDWFFSGEAGTAKAYVNSAGRTAYVWAYRPPNGVEDWSHSNLDIQGIYRAYAADKYGITLAKMLPLANTFLDVIRRGAHDYAGRVDGTDGAGNSAPTTSVRPNWYVAALFRPADYVSIVSADLTEGGTTGDITRFAYFLWVKCKLHPRECALPSRSGTGGAPGLGGSSGADMGGASGNSGGTRPIDVGGFGGYANDDTDSAGTSGRAGDDSIAMGGCKAQSDGAANRAGESSAAPADSEASDACECGVAGGRSENNTSFAALVAAAAAIGRVRARRRIHRACDTESVR
jgi:hypothetical protein